MKRTCVVHNLTLTLADTEYSFPFARSTVAIAVKSRTLADWKYSWDAALSGTTYVTIPAGGQLLEEDLMLDVKKTLYVQSSTAGLVLEISVWQ